MSTRRATRKSYGGELSGGELSGGAMASRVRLANLARGRAVRASNIMKSRAKGGLLHLPYKHKIPKTGMLGMRAAPDPVKEKGLYMRNAKRLLRWAELNDPDGFGELTLDEVLNTSAGKQLDELYESAMQETRGKRKPGAKTSKTSKDTVDPYLKATRIPLKNLTPADVELELKSIARVAPLMKPFVGGTGKFVEDVKLIRFIRKLLPKMPRAKATRLAYTGFLNLLKA